MVDRAARDELVAAIERYLAEEITAFEFDEAIEGISERADDSTVKDTVDALWFIYDDVKDHKVHASKETWDWLQRTLLLLRSDGELEWTSTRAYTPRQLVAACGLVGLVAAAVVCGWTAPLALAFAAAGGLTYLLMRQSRRDDRPDAWVVPFASVSEILKVRRSVPGFAKRRYPRHLAHRKLRSWPEELAMIVISHFVFGPLMLLAMSFPESTSTCRVVTP